MIARILNNIGTITAAAVIISIIAAAVIIIVKDGKKGKTSCGCNCAHCSMTDSCHKTK